MTIHHLYLPSIYSHIYKSADITNPQSNGLWIYYRCNKFSALYIYYRLEIFWNSTGRTILETRAFCLKPRWNSSTSAMIFCRSLVSSFVIRYHKCLSCYEKLIAIRAILLKKQSTTPGKLGVSFRDLAAIIRSLEWPELCRLWSPREFETTGIVSEHSSGTDEEQRNDRAPLSRSRDEIATGRGYALKKRESAFLLLLSSSVVTDHRRKRTKLRNARHSVAGRNKSRWKKMRGWR